jgi:outer membrane protein
MKTIRLPFSKTTVVAAVCAAMALVAVPAKAQNLVDLYDAARGYDSAFQSARSQADANGFKAEQARAGLLPTAGLAAGVSQSYLSVA